MQVNKNFNPCQSAATLGIGLWNRSIREQPPYGVQVQYFRNTLRAVLRQSIPLALCILHPKGACVARLFLQDTNPFRSACVFHQVRSSTTMPFARCLKLRAKIVNMACAAASLNLVSQDDAPAIFRMVSVGVDRHSFNRASRQPGSLPHNIPTYTPGAFTIIREQ